MNKKENDQLKKIDQLDKQLDNTINKIGVTKVEPIKISKKKLVLFMLIPFSIACVLSAVTSFLVIDPFHWYTKTRLTLEQKQEKTIKQIKQKFADLSLATAFDSSNTISDLLWEMKHSSSINEIVQSPNEIIAIISKKNNESKLSSIGEEVNIKILVRTGSLEKKINIALTIIVDNQTVKQVNGLVKYPQFLESITSKIAADGVKRVSNLVDVIKTIINEDKMYKAVFKDINFDIVNDKDDDEIIASGSKNLNINFNFTESNKLINSSVKLNVDLPGKSRKEININIADKLKFYGSSFYDAEGSYNFTAQTVFANESTYKELIDELILSAPKNNFYFSRYNTDITDNNDSRINVEFSIDNKTNEELEHKIVTNNDWEVITLKLIYFVGVGQDKYKVKEVSSFGALIMKKDYEYQKFFSYIGKVSETILKDLFKYKLNTKLGHKYSELNAELIKEIERLAKKVTEPKPSHGFNMIFGANLSIQSDSEIISFENLRYQDECYFARLYFQFNESEILNSPKIRPVYIYFPVL